MTKKRIEYIDYIKCFAIFLVVWGHAIQNISNDESFWTNPIHIFICSFHMPIFMLLSGFFFKNDNSSTFIPTILRKSRQLLLPTLSWSIILLIINIINNENEINSIISLFKTLLYYFFTKYWFLRSIFLCFLIAYISIRIFRNEIIAFFISFLIVLLLPDNFRLALDKYMYPFFWIGYFMNKYLDLILLKEKIILIISITLFILLLSTWKTEYYIYKSGMSFYKIDGCRLYFENSVSILLRTINRYIIGIAGSITFFIILKKTFNPRFEFISKIGQKTLGIYIIHLLFQGLIIKLSLGNNMPMIFVSCIISPAVALIEILLILPIINVIQKNQVLNLLLFGVKTN